MRGEIPVFTSKCVSFLNEGEIVLVAVKSYENKIWISFDEGWNWEEKTIDFPFQGQTWAFFDFVYDPHRELIWASTGAGLCYLNIDELSVGQKTVTFLPLGFMGIEAFPNPFNPATELTYTIPLSGEVTLTIYDIQGREVSTLLNGFQPAGSHKITFDAEDLPSGIYFARLSTANGQTKTQKLVLMK